MVKVKSAKNKVGNACRTKNQIRSSKARGSRMEYNTQESLRKLYPDILLTKELGFVKQYDLCSKKGGFAIECKFHKSLTWNELVKIHNKLEVKAPEFENHYLVYKTNQQPVLVMYQDYLDGKTIKTFESVFGTEFIFREKKNKNQKGGSGVVSV